MSTPTISDPGFEAPQVGGGNFQIAPSGSPWTFTGTGGVAANGSAINSGIANAPEGGQACLIQGIGSASQAVAGWEAGTYKLTLFGAQRYGQRNDINILVDGQVVAHYQPVVVADEQGNEVGYFFSEHTTPEFTVAAGSHTIKFQGLNTAGGDNCCFLDAVSLTQVSAGGGMQPAALTAGAVATSAVTATGLTLTVASIAGGVEPYATQFQQAPDVGNAPGTWANLGTAGTATTKVVTGLAPGTKYWFRASVTDSAGTPATANTLAVSEATDMENIDPDVPLTLAGLRAEFAARDQGYESLATTAMNALADFFANDPDFTAMIAAKVQPAIQAATTAATAATAAASAAAAVVTGVLNGFKTDPILSRLVTFGGGTWHYTSSSTSTDTLTTPTETSWTIYFRAKLNPSDPDVEHYRFRVYGGKTQIIFASNP